MVTTILRRGGAWRFAALGLLAASLIALFSPPGGEDAHAHVGTPGTLCGSVDTFLAKYMWQYTNPDGSHYHTWDFPPDGPPWHDEFCGYNPS